MRNERFHQIFLDKSAQTTNSYMVGGAVFILQKMILSSHILLHASADILFLYLLASPMARCWSPYRPPMLQ
jgi:hypothetical protein